MGGHILAMSQKERNRMSFLSQIKKNKMKIKEAAEVMRMCYRQARRIYNLRSFWRGMAMRLTTRL